MRTLSTLTAADRTSNRRATLSYMAPVLAALSLAACGGGGGESASAPSAMTSAQTASTASSTAVGSAIAPTATSSSSNAPAPSAQNTAPAGSSLTAQPNTHYEVNGAGTVDVTLPTSHLLKVGDVVSVRGAGANAWRLVPGFSATVTARGRTQPFYLSTTALSGNNAPGQVWTPRLDRKAWQAVATEPEGSVIVAADGAGQLHVSTDAGHTWTPGNSPAANWVAVAASRMTWTNPSGAAGQVNLVAAAQGGGLYRSSGDGQWTAVTSATADFANRDWVAVDVNEGGGITAAVFNGPIYAGATLAPATAAGSGAVLVRGWRGLARGNGLLAAVNEEGEVQVSTDGGVTFSLRNVMVDGSAVTTPWSRIAVSRDGRTIAVAGRNASALYLSRDGGLNWTRAAAPVGEYASIALSADGQVVGAALAGAGGSVQLSTNGGASFAASSIAGGDSDWRSIAMSDDGKQLVAAGRSATGTGSLATSLGDRTAYASGLGAVTGGSGDFVEAEYMGNMRWQVRQSSGGPFRIR